jgi:hypothetical protein
LLSCFQDEKDLATGRNGPIDKGATMVSNDTDIRFSLLDLRDLDKVAPAPVVAPLPAPDPETPGVTVRPLARGIAEQEQALAAVVGVALPAAYFALGTVMLPGAAGEGKAVRKVRAWEKRPEAAPALLALGDAVRAEDRRNDTVPVSDFRLDAEGYLGRGKGRLALTAGSWGQIRARCPEGADGEPVVDAPHNLNAWLGHASFKGHEAVFRSRKVGAVPERELYAVVGKRYRPFDLDQVCAVLAACLPAGARMVHRYESPARWRLDISLAPTFDVPGEIGVGRLHRFGLRVGGSDTGAGSAWWQDYAERILCVNCTILGAEGAKQSYRHIGASTEELQAAVAEALGKASERMAEFAALWGRAANTRYTDGKTGEPLPAREAVRRLIASGLLKAPGKAKALDEALAGALAVEPGDSVAAVNRAVTRLAHEGTWSASSWAQEELEEQAGQLLYSRAVALPAYSDEWRVKFEGKPAGEAEA